METKEEKKEKGGNSVLKYTISTIIGAGLGIGAFVYLSKNRKLPKWCLPTRNIDNFRNLSGK